MSETVFRPAFKQKLACSQWPVILQTPQPPKRLADAKVRINRQLGNIQPRQPADYDLIKTYQAFESLDRKKPEVASLMRRHIRRGPWILFRSLAGDNQPLAQRAPLRKAYYAFLSTRASDRTIATLAHVFLRDYPSDTPTQEATREFLRSELPERHSLQLQRLHQRCVDFALLEIDGPDRFAGILDKTTDADALLCDAGLTGDLVDQGFIEHAARCWLGLIKQNLIKSKREANDYIKRCLAFYKRSRASAAVLRFPALRALLVESLLLPFESTPPHPSVREPIERFVLDTLGDPRLSHGRWHGVDPAARDVLLRWLVHTTLKDFFRIVGHASKDDGDADRMWFYRDAFWSAYLDKGVIENAWVVLGSTVRSTSRSLLSQMDRNGYGELSSGRGSLPTHAVLIMQIADLIITEWSHSGKYRVWHVDDPGAPRFYQLQYSRDQVTQTPRFEGSHHHAESGSWQRRLAGEIRDRTGIYIAQREFMPHD